MSTLVITELMDIEGIDGIDTYVKNKGYEGLKKALKEYTPDVFIHRIGLNRSFDMGAGSDVFG